MANSYEVHCHIGELIPETYINFIISKWMRSYRYNNDYIKLIDSDSYFLAYRRYLLSLLINKKVTARIAVLSDDFDVALGFSVICGNTLHYVYVHKDYRRIGIGRNLVPIKVDSFTHLTKMGIKLWPTKMPDALFNPFQ